MEKKGLFTGWKDVFSFTATQNVKGSSYKTSTVVLGIVIAVIFALISVLMAVLQLDDEEPDDTVVVEDGFEEQIEEVFLVDSDVLDDQMLNTLITLSLSLEGVIEEKFNVTVIPAEDKDNYVNTHLDAVVVTVEKQDENDIVFSTFTSEESPLFNGAAEEYMDYVLDYIDIYGYQIAGVAPENLPYFMAPYLSQAVSVDENVQNVGVMLTEMFVPMICTLIIYAMVMLYGQNVTKSVVAEKSSKLMEMLLTSVKPYALITGKVLAVFTMAVLQLLIWIGCGAVGYIAGGMIADEINPDYVNYVDVITGLLEVDNGNGAFTLASVIIAILAIMIGFLMFCVIAALIASAVSKMEDVSTAMSMYQIPVVVGWIVSYLAPLLENELLMKAIYIIPVTSPFILPSDVILGKCGIGEGIISLVVLTLTTVCLILLTGKIYKGKIFNRK
ncbi:MAG: ABC transporter permease [Lachnospiraceae bacterium]|nr:ABC transporter permease [Lachnospiraceae bacterium]